MPESSFFLSHWTLHSCSSWLRIFITFVFISDKQNSRIKTAGRLLSFNFDYSSALLLLFYFERSYDIIFFLFLKFSKKKSASLVKPRTNVCKMLAEIFAQFLKGTKFRKNAFHIKKLRQTLLNPSTTLRVLHIWRLLPRRSFLFGSLDVFPTIWDVSREIKASKRIQLDAGPRRKILCNRWTDGFPTEHEDNGVDLIPHIHTYVP